MKTLPAHCAFLAAAFLFAIVLPAPAAMPTSASIDAFAADFLAVREARGFKQPLTLREAPAVQRQFVSRLRMQMGKPVGYKVGLVTRDAQKRFGVDGPVRGVLLEKMLLPNESLIPAGFAVRPLLEADLIVVVKDKAINDAESILDVAEHLKEIVAFIELPDSFIVTNPPPTGALLMAGNVGARLGVMGRRLPVEATPQFVKALAEMTVTMTDGNGVVLGRERGSVILDHPLNAVLWLMEELQRDGIRLRAGDMISLGSIKAVPAPHGKSVTVKYDGLPGGPIDVTAKFE